MPSPQHYYMVTATLVYKQGDEPAKQRIMNTLITTNTKKFTSVMLNNSRLACMQRMTDESKVTVDEFKDFIINNISYLGLMTSIEFEGKTAH